MFEILISLLLLGSLVAIAVLLYILYQEIQRQNRKPLTKPIIVKPYNPRRERFSDDWRKMQEDETPKPPKPEPVQIPDTFKPPEPRISARTQNQLFRLVQGDQELAVRLVDRVRRRNPDRPEQWCWEKAIWELERDRH